MGVDGVGGAVWEDDDFEFVIEGCTVVEFLDGLNEPDEFGFWGLEGVHDVGGEGEGAFAFAEETMFGDGDEINGAGNPFFGFLLFVGAVDVWYDVVVFG